VTEFKILENNKEAKRFLDVAPPWGEPCISGVSWFFLCNVFHAIHLLSALIMMCNVYIFCCLSTLFMLKGKRMLELTHNDK
jgi:hypothetical protein